MVVIIIGTPGTGKSTLAARLGEEHERAVYNITKMCQEQGLDDEWDAKNNCFLVDQVRLERMLKELAALDPDCIIDGHLSHHIPPDLVEQCIVCKCDLQELKRRLEERGYSEDKVRENLDCEIFDVCATEASEMGHKVDVFWSSEKPDLDE